MPMLSSLRFQEKWYTSPLCFSSPLCFFPPSSPRWSWCADTLCNLCPMSRHVSSSSRPWDEADEPSTSPLGDSLMESPSISRTAASTSRGPPQFPPDPSPPFPKGKKKNKKRKPSAEPLPPQPPPP